jgi:hypothetical protein
VSISRTTSSARGEVRKVALRLIAMTAGRIANNAFGESKS